MGKTLIFITFIIYICIQAAVGYAEPQMVEYDPLKRNLLFVEGESKKEFPVNIFRLKLGFDAQRSNFTEANAYSEELIKGIEMSIKGLGLKNVKIIKGWDVVKQAKISVGASGSKLTNQLIIEVRDFPANKMQELISGIIDRSLAVNKDIYLERVDSGITEEMEDAVKEEVLMEALRRLKANAEKAAQSQDKRVLAAKRIFVVSGQGNVAIMDNLDDKRMVLQEQALARGFVSIQKGFNVRSEVNDHVKISAKVVGIYETD